MSVACVALGSDIHSPSLPPYHKAIPGGSEEIMLDLGIRMANKVSQLYGAKM